MVKARRAIFCVIEPWFAPRALPWTHQKLSLKRFLNRSIHPFENLIWIFWISEGSALASFSSLLALNLTIFLLTEVLLLLSSDGHWKSAFFKWGEAVRWSCSVDAFEATWILAYRSALLIMRLIDDWIGTFPRRSASLAHSGIADWAAFWLWDLQRRYSATILFLPSSKCDYILSCEDEHEKGTVGRGRGIRA